MSLLSVEEVSSQKKKKRKKKTPHIIICLMYIFFVDEFPYKKNKSKTFVSY